MMEPDGYRETNGPGDDPAEARGPRRRLGGLGLIRIGPLVGDDGARLRLHRSIFGGWGVGEEGAAAGAELVFRAERIPAV